ncbi:MAG: type II toxin-antitoxin system death-on-curing family toxin [Phreatobacter sp.]|uniref:type II toxin-antitoxin system death-on-curing family toxin n=1 Tax=Phreatobacter sp. TaxID=1966341 RepID=UPI0040364D72
MLVEPRWVDIEQALQIHTEQLAEHGGAAGVRYEGLLASALARPQNLYGYQPDATIQELAASYAHGLAKNHPFIDGNKRTSYAVTALFLEMCGFRIAVDEGHIVETWKMLAEGLIDEVDMAEWFDRYLEPIET